MRFTFLLLLPVFLAAQTPRHFIYLPAELKEISGMTRTPNGDLWMLNDSHNPPILFRYDPLHKKVLERRTLPVPNRDWEDLSSDPKGNLYIADFGNNNNKRKDLCIFKYNPKTGALDSINFVYPDQRAFPPAEKRDWNFNGEALVYFQDSLHLFSKNAFKGNFVCKHYVLSAQPGRYVATLRDSMVLQDRVVTGAGISADGKTLALTSYVFGKRWGFLPYTKCSVFYFTDFKGSQFFKGNKRMQRLPHFLIARQYESIAQWKGNIWLVGNEGRRPQRQAIRRIKQ